MRWTPKLHENAVVRVSGGRIVNPLWRVYSSDLVWDEDSNSGKNQWVFSQQLGIEKTLPLNSRLRLAGAYHKWSDENRSDFGQLTIQDGNRRSNATGRLVSQFRVGEVTAQLTSWIGSIPLNFQGTAIRNFGVKNNELIQGPVGRDGYQAGLIVGAAKAKGQWEAAYFKKYSQIDSTVADVADSDFGDGGTNRVGHIAWIGYAPRDWMLLKVKGFVTDTLDRSFPTVAKRSGTARKSSPPRLRRSTTGCSSRSPGQTAPDCAR